MFQHRTFRDSTLFDGKYLYDIFYSLEDEDSLIKVHNVNIYPVIDNVVQNVLELVVNEQEKINLGKHILIEEGVITTA